VEEEGEEEVEMTEEEKEREAERLFVLFERYAIMNASSTGLTSTDCEQPVSSTCGTRRQMLDE